MHNHCLPSPVYVGLDLDVSPLQFKFGVIFLGVYAWLVKVLGHFSIIYFRGLGLRIGVWVRVGVRVWVRIRVMVRVSVVLLSG